MKHRSMFKVFILIIITFLFVPYIQAQPHGGPKPPSVRGPFSSVKRFRELKKELNLTLDQEIKVKKILDDQRKEMDQMIDSMEQEREDMFEKMEQQRKQTNANIVTVLTEQQKKKFEELQKKRSRRFEHPPEPME